MKAQNTINLGQISGEMKTWNNSILRPKGLIANLIILLVLRWRSMTRSMLMQW